MKSTANKSMSGKSLAWQSGPKLLSYDDGSVVAPDDPRLHEGLVDVSHPDQYHTISHSKPKRAVLTPEEKEKVSQKRIRARFYNDSSGENISVSKKTWFKDFPMLSKHGVKDGAPVTRDLCKEDQEAWDI